MHVCHSFWPSESSCRTKTQSTISCRCVSFDFLTTYGCICRHFILCITVFALSSNSKYAILFLNISSFLLFSFSSRKIHLLYYIQWYAKFAAFVWLALKHVRMKISSSTIIYFNAPRRNLWKQFFDGHVDDKKQFIENDCWLKHSTRFEL